ncbi:TPA: tyrosine-type recombinase/integrase [Escherichia coli]|nr:tyrosine-type recombinase/integrase [Escherichia coli]MDD8409862.1 tyrosine-type recombinase/integrase [Escherichia coli]MDD8794347.1 tyrosine-type recombinase/integrase [Escherichia coli]HAJ6553148.1 site-specific integrase [Escherichia coli]HDP7587071.1 tyrosine-type recombinase/integrase [Escherichia coli]
MAVRKLTTGKWLCECYPAGRSGRRVRKQFATKGEALAFERHTMEETESKPWLGESVDRRTLKDVVELWFKLHGKSLTAGQHVYDKLLLMVGALGNPLATDLTSKMFAHYRDKRLTGEIYFSEKWKKGASPVTINLEQSYLSSVFSELSRLGEWSYPNPLENMRKFTIAEKEMAWLTHEQIVELLADCKRQDPILALVVKICLSTGARWREAVNLTRSQVTKYRITFVRTKGKKNRSIPISKELYEEIMALDGFNFFTDCYFQFLSVMEKTSIVLPRGQLTHVLRHTFAAHFMMSGGNILALQKILGHHDLKMTMRYAHLAPDHLETALRFNPLATLPSGDKVAAAVGITP